MNTVCHGWCSRGNAIEQVGHLRPGKLPGWPIADRRQDVPAKELVVVLPGTKRTFSLRNETPTQGVTRQPFAALFPVGTRTPSVLTRWAHPERLLACCGEPPRGVAPDRKPPLPSAAFGTIDEAPG